MDLDLENRVRQSLEHLRDVLPADVDTARLDPIAKLMLVALLHEAQSLHDYIDRLPERIVERFCSDFVPGEKVGAVPSIALLAPEFKKDKDIEAVTVTSGAAFTFKPEAREKVSLNFIPVFETLMIPYSDIYVLTSGRLTGNGKTTEISFGRKNSLWVGIQTKVEVDCLQGLSLLVRGTNGVTPERIIVGVEKRGLEFATMNEMENVTMLEPFDAQQSSGQFFTFLNTWKDCLLNMKDAALMYITDRITDRDLFKPRSYPKVFQQWLEDEVLDCFTPATLWLQLDFPKGYRVPCTAQVSINVLPVANVDICSLTLTQSNPIAKLQKQEGAFFLKVLETSSAAHKQGFSMTDEEIVVRDFDASCYHNGDLYRDVRTLYNHFIDDFYAFKEYNDIKDGKILGLLRETINRLGKSVCEANEKYKFDSGTYAMKNLSQENATSNVKVSYITTMGRIGELLVEGSTVDNRKLPAIVQKVKVAVGAMGAADKASADARYELMRYYALTNDRLYTRMDVDAFLRKEIMAEFGKKEFGTKELGNDDSRRIFIRISIEGAGGERSLRRGLYIDIEFKDRKNYDHAVNIGFDTLMQQRIQNHSCIAMPIIVTLKNLEE